MTPRMGPRMRAVLLEVDAPDVEASFDAVEVSGDDGGFAVPAEPADGDVVGRSVMVVGWPSMVVGLPVVAELLVVVGPESGNTGKLLLLLLLLLLSGP